MERAACGRLTRMEAARRQSACRTKRSGWRRRCRRGAWWRCPRSADGRIWREEYQLAEAAQEIPQTESADDTNFYTYTDASGNTYDLFEIVKWQEDENHHVTAVTGRFERVVTEDDCETGAYADDGQTVTFPLAADFSAMMLGSMTDADMQLVPVTDLRAWYISAYLMTQRPKAAKLFSSMMLRRRVRRSTSGSLRCRLG